ncbi:hypothetical protein, partial [Neisseria sicca]|uniref:hypothetical protein n=1 Tax=Neisseria sicca TaxID=490 RepID=UPI001C99B51B
RWGGRWGGSWGRVGEREGEEGLGKGDRIYVGLGESGIEGGGVKGGFFVVGLIGGNGGFVEGKGNG